MLIVDDDDEFCAALTDYLATYEEIGVVGTAGDVHELAELSETIEYDLAVVDVRMPEGGGPAAVEWLISNRPDVKIIGLSAYRDAGPRDEMLEKGALRFVLKGERPSELAEAILTVD